MSAPERRGTGVGTLLALLLSLSVHALGLSALGLGLYPPHRFEPVDPSVVRLRLVPGELEVLPAAGAHSPAPAPNQPAAPAPAPAPAQVSATAAVPAVTPPAQPAAAPSSAPIPPPAATAAPAQVSVTAAAPAVTPSAAPAAAPSSAPIPPPAASPPAELEFSEARPGPDNSPPRYPLSARRRGLEGEVLLKVGVGSDGAVLEVSLWRSSGHAVLDRAALEAVRAWRFLPARRGTVPLAQEIFVPVSFRLLDSP